MGPAKRGAIFLLTVVTVAVVGALGVQAIRAPEEARWPDRIAVIGIDETDGRRPLTYLGLGDPVRKAAVTVPADAVVEVPGSGFLRAHHAYRLGGAELVRGTLGRLFGVDVPFSVVGTGTTFEDVVGSYTEIEVASGHTEDLQIVLEEESSRWERIEVSGEPREGPQGLYVALDPASVSRVARTVGGLGTKVFADPGGDGARLVSSPVPGAPTETPAPTATPPEIDPAEVMIDVLNGGEVRLAATETAERLSGLGYDVRRIADEEPQDHERSVVYWRTDDPDAEPMARQVAAELGYPAEPLADGIPIKQASHLVVLLGHDADV